uniref:Uncharacterized protein n=1 Tax=Knipowitschia caucasica TaxID=637954 RepID=A0AAV2L4J5_KNICA
MTRPEHKEPTGAEVTLGPEHKEPTGAEVTLGPEHKEPTGAESGPDSRLTNSVTASAMYPGTATAPPATAHTDAHSQGSRPGGTAPPRPGDQGPRPGGTALPGPGDQGQHKPFFYVQPPFLPMQNLQWPPLMPLHYSPYYGGFPGYGYGLPLMPHFPPAPYLEAPGFVLPHSHHHLMDYRRMLNPQYYQSMAYHARRLRFQQNAPTRDVTSAEVQTEPMSEPGLSRSEASRDSGNASTALSAQRENPTSANATPQKGGFVIEAEEVRIQCCASPLGLTALRSPETSEMSRRFAQEVVHCSSIVQNASVADNEETVENKTKTPQPCPDILLVNPTEGVVERAASPSGRSPVDTKVENILNEKNLKVVRLPFNAKYLSELRDLEASIWTPDQTLVPSPDFFMDSCSELFSGEVPSSELATTREEVLHDECVPIVHLPPALSEDLASVVPTFVNPVVQIQRKELSKPSRVCGKVGHNVCGKVGRRCSAYLLSDDSVGKPSDHHETSFESLPAYLPSWLADFQSYGKIPSTPQKSVKPLWSKSLNVPDLQSAAVRKPKERNEPRAERRSASDNECCVSRSYNENLAVSYEKKPRLCTRCFNKRRAYHGPDKDSRPKAAPFQLWNDQTCVACTGFTSKRFGGKGCCPDVQMEGELSESSCRRKRRESKHNSEEGFSKRRGCGCGERHRYHHGDAIREADENNRQPPCPPPRWQTVRAHGSVTGRTQGSLSASSSSSTVSRSRREKGVIYRGEEHQRPRSPLSWSGRSVEPLPGTAHWGWRRGLCDVTALFG